MKKQVYLWGWVCLLGMVSVVGVQAQPEPIGAEPEAPGKAGSGTGVSPVEPTGGVSLPRLIKFTGILKDRLGQPRSGIVGVTFALYQDQQGGAPLWLEVQNLELDDQGRYTVLLGATQTGGLPLELFAAGRARWLGVQVQGEEESPEASGRILLVSVPYALKAADAETLGGKPASAFVLAEEAKSGGSGISGTGVGGTGVPPVSLLSGPGSTKEQVTGTGTINRIAKFLTSTSVGDSALFESGGNLGLGTTSPAVKLQVNVTNPSAGTIIGSSALSVGSVDIVTTDAQGANVGPILALGGNRATTGTNLGVFGGIRGAKENSTDGNAAGYLGFYTLQAGVAFAERMRISSSGLVGMGTLSPNPGARLTLVGGLHMRGAVADLTVPDGENLQLGHLNFLGGLFTERMRITPTGNVGIATTTPGQKLEVAGNLKLSGAGSGLIFPDATSQTTAGLTPATANTLYAQLAAANTFAAHQTFTTGSFGGNTEFTILSVTQNGSGIGVAGGATSGVGVKGSASTGTGVEGGGLGSGSVGVFGFVNTTGGITGHVGVKGLVGSDGSPGSGIAGLFHNRTGGKILSGLTGGFPGTEVFSVGGDGTVELKAQGAANATTAFNSGHLELTASAFDSDLLPAPGAVEQSFQWEVEPVGSNTPTPSAKLNLLFGSGATAPAATGLAIASNGLIAFATGQTFSGSATQAALDAEATARASADSALQADINTRVAKAGDTMTGTLNLPANGLVAGTNQLVLAAGRVGIGTAGPTQALEVVGTAKATAFVGDGSGLSNVNTAVLASLLARIEILENIAFPPGSHLWSKRFGSTGQDQGFAVAVDSSGNLVVTGSFEVTVDFGGGPLTSAGSGADIFVAKYSGTDGAHLWSKRFGSTGQDQGFAVAVDGNGNVLVTGLVGGTVDFGGGPLTGGASGDIFVVKLSGADGSHVWSKRFGSTGFDKGLAVAVDSSGNVVVTGSFGLTGAVPGATADFGGGALTSAGSWDIFVAKYSGADGAHLWSKRFGSTSDDQGFAVAVDSSGNVVVTGFFAGTSAVPGNTVDFGGGGLTTAGSADIFVAKYSGADGAHLWSKRFGSTGTGQDQGFGVAVDGNGNVLVTGLVGGTVDFGGGPLTSAGGSDIFVLKLSGADGAHLWSKRFGSTSTDQGLAVAIDSSGNVVVTGLFVGSVDFGGGPLGNAGFDEIFVAKYSGVDGAHLWSKRFGGTGSDRGLAVAVDSSGNVVVTGFFQGTVDFGGGPLTSAGGLDIFVLKLRR